MNWLSLIFLCLVPFVIWYKMPLPWRGLLLIAWKLKMVSAISLGIIYQYVYNGGDTFSLFQDAEILFSITNKDFNAYIDIFLNTIKGQAIDSTYGLGNSNPRAVLMSLINSILFWLSGGNYWFSALLLATFSFVFIANFLITVHKVFKLPIIKLVVAFLCFPSVLFWSSGLLKENILLTGLCFVLSLYLRLLHPSKFKLSALNKWMYFMALLLVLFFLFRLKYYYIAVFAPLLLAHFFTKKTSPYFQRIWQSKTSHFVPYLLFISFFTISIFFATRLHPNLHIENILKAIVVNHEKMAYETTAKENLITYKAFEPTLASFIVNLPKAFVSGLARPYLWEKGKLLKKINAIENLIILWLIGYTLYKLIFLKAYLKMNIEILAMAIYVLSMLILLSFAAPNVGTLARYKIGYLPFLLLLILPNWHNIAFNEPGLVFKKTA